MFPSVPGYDIVKVLSSGGFGTVYQGRRQSDGRVVAIKVLNLQTDDNVRRFYREGVVLHRHLADPNVVDLLDARFDSSPFFIVMEFCSGGSLRPWVSAKRTVPDVLRAVLYAAKGLSAIHAQGGFHRDVKPDNLLITSANGTWVVKVGDFGLARMPDTSAGSTMTHSPCGTHGYMAPELSLGAAFDDRCDIYSLGVTLAELLTGVRDLSVIQQRGDVPQDVRNLVSAMVSRDPARRPAIREVSRRLQAALVPAPQVKQASAQPEKSGGAGWLAALLGLGALAYATSNSKDDNGRWRDNKGRFRSGLFS